MKKAELIEITERYNMQFIRHPITQEGNGVYCESSELIPELDEICDRQEFDNVVGERRHIPPSGYLYRLYCPKPWIDLCGWH